ncbi:MAG TPA: metallophosphoesterase [bacterium]|nr:metallophosphoesterase [bacterium]
MLYITADLHLSGGNPDKEMGNKFPLWQGHQERLAAHWRAIVRPDDTVIVAGDISWALKPATVAVDLQFIHELPGQRKLLLRGNHDYWLPKTEAKQRELLAPWPSLAMLPRDRPTIVDDFALAGTRLWKLPGAEYWDEAIDPAIYAKEKLRLADCLRTLQRAPADKLPVLILHHPPHDPLSESEGEAEKMIAAAGITRVYYGHLHPDAGEQLPAQPYTRHGVTYQLIAVDSHDFSPVPVTL